MIDDPQSPRPPADAPEFLPSPEAAPAPSPTPEREPFWSYADLFLFAGLALPAMLAGVLAVKGLLRVFGIHSKLRVVELLPAEFLGYALLFGILYTLLKLQYDRPFWASLGWRKFRMPGGAIMLAGIGTAFSIGILGKLLNTPDVDNPMKQLLADPRSLVVIAVFGTTLGPLCEELAFRGFLQPLLVRSLGATAGIIVTAIPFGLLHLDQYGYSWRHALLVTCAGAAFGWMRHYTNSTRASTLMHAAYNGIFFIALLAQRRELSNPW